jgi:hypothetical protein
MKLLVAGVLIGQVSALIPPAEQLIRPVPRTTVRDPAQI